MNQNKGQGEIIRALALLTQLGISMAVCVLMGVFMGKYLDIFFGTSPVLLIIFSILGGATSFKVMYDIVIKDSYEKKDDYEKKDSYEEKDSDDK